jgi:sugar O-acyltransferase (sialic acid O-acetyltransferase NeuD family)
LEDIFIIGAGGLAKEIHFLIRQIGGFNIRAFVDKAESISIKAGSTIVPVIGEDELNKFRGAYLALGIGDPELIRELADKFSGDFFFPNLIHPNVVADWKGIKIGIGNIICSGVNLTTDISIGNFNILNICCTIGHDTNIGNGNVINPCCNISGGINIGNGILVGTNATILQNKNIGDNSIIGASSLVIRNVAPETTVVGVPAEVLIRKQ